MRTDYVVVGQDRSDFNQGSVKGIIMFCKQHDFNLECISKDTYICKSQRPWNTGG